MVLTIKDLIGLQLERAVALRACPAARHADVDILVEQHLAIGADIREVHGAVPVHIIVAGRVLAIAGLAVGTVAIAVEANLRVGKELLVANDRDDGQRVFVVGLDIAARDGNAGQIALLIEAHGEVGGLVEGKDAILALLAVAGRRHLAAFILEGLPIDVVDIEVVGLTCQVVEVEGDGLQFRRRGIVAPHASSAARLVVGDGAFALKLLPLGGDVEGVAILEHLPMDIAARCAMRLGVDITRHVGTDLHAEAVFVAGIPDVVGGIDKELRVP